MDHTKLKNIATAILQDFLVALKLVQAAIIKKATAWTEFKNLELTPKELIVKYYLPVAVLGAIASTINLAVIGITTHAVTIRAPFFSTLFFGLTQILIMIAAIVLAALVINKLSNIEILGKPASTDAVINWLVYGALIASSAQLLSFIPYLGFLAIMALGLYSLYFLWIGVNHYLQQSEKCLQFSVVSLVTLMLSCLILLSVHTKIFGTATYAPNEAEQLNIKLNEQLQNSLDKLIQK